jgi:hypothetical protein
VEKKSIEPVSLSKFRVPVGSLVVDASLVVALIWWGASMTEKFTVMSRRMDLIEQVKIQPEADRRIAVIESRMVDTTARLQSIEAKLDRALERR